MNKPQYIEFCIADTAGPQPANAYTFVLADVGRLGGGGVRP